MTRIALVSSEPLKARMAGIGIRYVELARRLPAWGIAPVLISPADPAEVPATGLPAADVRRFDPARLGELLADCRGAVCQGQLANDVLLARPDLPVAIDLYDPWLVENLHYAKTLGYGPYQNDHATWMLQLSRGDFFLCSSEEQRLYYLGLLTALGRVNPDRLAVDPDLAGLIAPVPFGLPAELPPHEPLLPPRTPGEWRILFGGLYDWYDPWTLLEALEGLELPAGRRPVVLFIRNPNPDSTPQRLFSEVEAFCRKRGTWGTSVQALDWIPSARRYDLLREVDVLVSPHRPSLETRLSLRTRYLDALAAGCPVISTAGGTVARLLEHHAAGRVVPPGEPRALAAALVAVAGTGGAEFRAGAAAVVESFAWERALAPLVAFCREPRLDTTKAAFAFAPGTRAPADGLGFRLGGRLRRRLPRLFGGGA
jgi:hypothetical protein